MRLSPLPSLDRSRVLDRFRRSRARTRALFDLLDPAAYYTRPIPLRNPIVFYEGHLPVFAVNTLLKRALGQPGIDAHLETIFARGIDPDEESAAIARGNPAWPTRDSVRAYADEADKRLAAAMDGAEIEQDGNPLLEGAEALWTILEHEEMHQETLAYIWHEVPYTLKRKPEHYLTAPPRLRDAPSPKRVTIPPGTATLGTVADAFGWDNERPEHRVHVPAFSVDAYDVTNGEYLEYVRQTGAPIPHFWVDAPHPPTSPHPPDPPYQWRGMFEQVPLPLAWPVYVTWEEALGFARWRGLRLPTEAEFHRAAYGTPDGAERDYPWGHDMPHRAPANFDFIRWDPDPVGAHPDAASAFGVHDLVGNGWEWTGDLFAPFAGFAPMASYPEYSADFFDGQHYVMKGASPVTPGALVRRGFRNWFRPAYPYVYATFRCVSDAR